MVSSGLSKIYQIKNITWNTCTKLCSTKMISYAIVHNYNTDFIYYNTIIIYNIYIYIYMYRLYHSTSAISDYKNRDRGRGFNKSDIA